MNLNDVDNLDKAVQSFVERVDFEIGLPCFEWVGHRHAGGYGQFNVRLTTGYKIMSAHRVAFLLYNDYLLDDLDILHSCDNRGCVNPLHLRQGDDSMNAIDRESRGRGVDNSGENNGRALMDWSIVRSIRADKSSGAKTRQIFSKYPQFKQRTIESVLYKTSWIEG